MSVIKSILRFVGLVAVTIAVIPPLVVILLLAAYVWLVLWVMRETRLGDLVDRLTSGE